MFRQRAVEVADPSVPADPRVSVALITYNQERFIAEAIDGVLMQQTTFAWELVIGEDYSTDRTRQIVQAYQRKHPGRIRLLLQPSNTRGYANYAEAVQSCRGDYVAELEGDDFWTDPLKLQLQVEMLQSNPAAFICGARARVWAMGAEAPGEISPGQDIATLSEWGTRELFESKWWFRTCTKMYPRRLLQSVPRRFHLDWAATLWLIAKTNFAPACFLDRVVAVYREHPGGSWSSMPHHRQVASDVRVLFNLVPVFAGADRDYLKKLLNANVGELLSLDEAPASTKIRCAGLAALRCPENALAWRRLLASIRLAVRARRRSVTPD